MLEGLDSKINQTLRLLVQERNEYPACITPYTETVYTLEQKKFQDLMGVKTSV